MAHCYHHAALVPGLEGHSVELSEYEARHAAVARLRGGEHVMLTSGGGVLAESTVLESGKRATTLRVETIREVAAPSPRITLIQALAKGDRSDIAVAAATELGVDAIVPWQAERSIVQWRGEKAVRGTAKWQQAATEASKQAIRAWIPEVAQPATTAELAALDAQLIVLDPYADARLGDVVEQRDLAFIVGPEGGIAAAELEALDAAGAHRVRLGAEVLRTSTAGLAGIAAVSPMLGRW